MLLDIFNILADFFFFEDFYIFCTVQVFIFHN